MPVKIWKEIAGRIWALWGLLTFVITFLIVFLPSMITWLIPDPKGTAIFIRMARIWMNVWLWLVGCPVRITGRDNFVKGNSYIVTFNHNSMLDIPLSCPYIPGPNKTIAKISFSKVPLFGWYYRKGSVLVDRKSESSRRQSFEEMKAVLQKGMHMSIYPEGTRNRTGQPLKRFYDGAFKLAVETKASIIPVLIFNTSKALPVNKPFYLLPKKLEMHFLPAISPEGLTSEGLKQKVFNIMAEHYVRHSN